MLVDFSESSKDALRCAVSLAQKFNEPLTILYAYRLLDGIEGEAASMKNQIENDALKKFNALETNLK
ncbi:MAG: universal stress protein [Cyclobacteriaceae bacterium]